MFLFGATVIRPLSWLIELDQIHSSYLVLLSLATAALLGAVFFYLGFIRWGLRLAGLLIRISIVNGFRLWEHLLSWAPWPLFLAIVFGSLGVSEAAGELIPGLRIVGGLLLLLMGTTTCLAYMFIDLERYEVERGYKALHNPLKGQELALHLARYGHQVRVPLLLVATVGTVTGFALLNQGLYETLGHDWYQMQDEQTAPAYVDFLAYALIHLLNIVNVFHVAQSNHFLRTAFVHPAHWPAALLLIAYKLFFTMVLLQQIFASLRQGKLLAETIADFWSPHEPIHERACNALPQYGARAVGQLLVSLRTLSSLTREQRDQLPAILATIGHSAIRPLLRHVQDGNENVRAIAAAALGQLNAVNAVPLLAALARDPSEFVRQSVVEALGRLGSAPAAPARRKPRLRSLASWKGRLEGLFRRHKKAARVEHRNPVELAVMTLESALADPVTGVRTRAIVALGQIGPAATRVASRLIALLKDPDETVRCLAAETLGKVGGEEKAMVAALTELLQDASGVVKAAAARTLGSMKKAAAAAVSSLVPLLQDREEAVRTAAAAAIAVVGPLNEATTDALVEGLASPDTVVRAQTAESLGTIGPAEATPALVEAMEDSSDRVRAKVVTALGKIGESAAEAAVPGLVRALRDEDNWVSALAAEALGLMGESADEAIPALVHSLGHINAQVRGNAAEALGKMGETAASARPALEKASQDEDAVVRCQSLRALGMLGRPTATSVRVVLAGLQDSDPLVRIAAVESLGRWGEPDAKTVSAMLPLLEDANDEVKAATARVLPKLAGATEVVIEGLCRLLLEDDSTWVQVQAAQALGQLGAAAVAAGGALLHAVQTGDASVREQAMRAIAMIQPPEILSAFTAGLKDANDAIRKVASGGWRKAAAIPEEVIPLLVMALRDPEVQVRANAAHALARLDSLPAEAIPLLVACTADASDAVRINAAMALQTAPPAAAGETMQHLIEDTNLRIRLIAASCLLASDLGNVKAGAVLVEALDDPAPRVRKAALELVESLGLGGAAYLDVLKKRADLEGETDLREMLVRLIERLENQAAADPQPVDG